MTVTIFGIKNCDTIKKALSWLDAQSVEYVFHDYKKNGVPSDKLQRWCHSVGWETVLNKRGATFRKLPDKDKNDLDQEKAVKLMIANPSVIKRPVLEAGSEILVGFKPEAYEEILS